MDDTLHDILKDLEKRLPGAEERAAHAKLEWNRAINEVASLHQSIDSFSAYIKAREDSAKAREDSVHALATSPSPRGRRSRGDVVAVMEEARDLKTEWTIDDLVEAFVARGWTLYMERPAAAIKNMTSRLVAEGSAVERVRPGIYRLRAPQRFSTDSGIRDENANLVEEPTDEELDDILPLVRPGEPYPT
jgi:hypothetical protein